MNLLEMRAHPDRYAVVAKIDRKDVRLLWHSGYYDGPYNGLLVYREQKLWFEMLDESVGHPGDPQYPGWYRRYAILRLTREQLEIEEKWHELFREKVGAHTDYDENGSRPIGQVMPREMWNEFYEPAVKRTPEDFSSCEVVGWYEVG